MSCHRRSTAAAACLLAIALWGCGARPEGQSPASAPQGRIVEQSVTVGHGRIALPGTLSAPPSSSEQPQPARPALVLVPGSGPQDRDGTVGPNRPLRDLAWGLSARGHIVLRYDKRSLVYRDELSAAELSSLTLEQDTVSDALAAVARLRQVPGVDPSRIYVLGHSQGATAVPRIARGDRAIAGFIILAGATRPLENVLVGQIEYLSMLDGTVSPTERAVLDKLEAQAARVKALRPDHGAPPAELPQGRPAAYWLDLAAHRPGDLLRSERRPVLVLHADRDYQVTLADFRGWQRALAANPNASFRRYPTLNHLFMAGTGASSPQEYYLAGHVAPQVIADIASWLAAR